MIGEMREVSFAHSLVHWNPSRVDDADWMVRESLDCYQQMLRRHRLVPPAADDGRMAGSYNLLVTRRWMLMVPRVRECFHPISFNSLAFAGHAGPGSRQMEQLAGSRAVCRSGVGGGRPPRGERAELRPLAESRRPTLEILIVRAASE